MKDHYLPTHHAFRFGTQSLLVHPRCVILVERSYLYGAAPTLADFGLGISDLSTTGKAERKLNQLNGR